MDSQESTKVMHEAISLCGDIPFGKWKTVCGLMVNHENVSNVPSSVTCKRCVSKRGK